MPNRALQARAGEVEKTALGGISDRMARDPELEHLAGAMRERREHDLAHLATLEEPCHRAHHQDETPGPPPEPAPLPRLAERLRRGAHAHV
jgi:hypothetical protein